MSLLVKLQFI
uniref:Uncharacterized protein n=1 Tax=Anguilla anguilla TaxID=7936 RepID=A0A0E9TBC0_ANGAN